MTGVSFNYSIIYTYRENIPPKTDQHPRDFKNPPEISSTPFIFFTNIIPIFNNFLLLSYLILLSWGACPHFPMWMRPPGVSEWTRTQDALGAYTLLTQNIPCISHLIRVTLCSFYTKLKSAMYFGVCDFAWCLQWIYGDTAEVRTQVYCTVSSRNTMKTLSVGKWKQCEHWTDRYVGASGSSFHSSVSPGTLLFSVGPVFSCMKCRHWCLPHQLEVRNKWGQVNAIDHWPLGLRSECVCVRHPAYG